MFSIGEFSKICGLPVKTLRFYHERGLLVPAKIGAGSGYRYYDQRNVEVARVIAVLRTLEFSLDEISEILAEASDDEDLLDRLSAKKAEIAARLDRDRELVNTLGTIITQERELRERIMNSEQDQVIEKEISPVLVGAIRYRGKYAECGKAFSTIGRKLGRYIAGKAFCLYYDGEYKEDDADIEACMPIREPKKQPEGVDVRELPGGRCLSLIHRGPYDTLKPSYQKIFEAMKSRGVEADLPSREVYIKGPGMIFKGNPKKYITEIQMFFSEQRS